MAKLARNRRRDRLRLSSPGLTGRSSIPETIVMDPKGCGVLDRPVKPDDDSAASMLRIAPE
ncbi:MAG TPA: hypothetical protein VGO54_02600 [Bradyrhizobium sp.]|nr:hypothetical protein [Bradyrhizobium sp.]